MLIAVHDGIFISASNACFLAAVLTALGRLAGHILFFVLILRHEQNIRLGIRLLQWTASHGAPTEVELHWPLQAMDALAILAAYELCWRMRPRFGSESQDVSSAGIIEKKDSPVGFFSC